MITSIWIYVYNRFIQDPIPGRELKKIPPICGVKIGCNFIKSYEIKRV